MDDRNRSDSYRKLSRLIREEGGLPISRLQRLLNYNKMNWKELQRRDPDLHVENRMVIASSIQKPVSVPGKEITYILNHRGRPLPIELAHKKSTPKISVSEYRQIIEGSTKFRIVAEEYIGLKTLGPPSWFPYLKAHAKKRPARYSPGIFGAEWLRELPSNKELELHTGATITQEGFQSFTAQWTSDSPLAEVHIEVSPVLQEESPQLALRVTARGNFFQFLNGDDTGWNFWPGSCVNPLDQPRNRVYIEDAIYDDPDRFTAISLAASPLLLLSRLLQVWIACSKTEGYSFAGIRAHVDESTSEQATGPIGKTVNYEKKSRTRSESDVLCALCENPLTDPKSISRGYGPHCWESLSPEIRFKTENEVGDTDYVFAVDRLPRYRILFSD